MVGKQNRKDTDITENKSSQVVTPKKRRSIMAYAVGIAMTFKIVSSLELFTGLWTSEIYLKML